MHRDRGGAAYPPSRSCGYQPLPPPLLAVFAAELRVWSGCAGGDDIRIRPVVSGGAGGGDDDERKVVADGGGPVWSAFCVRGREDGDGGGFDCLPGALPFLSRFGVGII